jgi:hypothetical protein
MDASNHLKLLFSFICLLLSQNSILLSQIYLLYCVVRKAPGTGPMH